MSARGFGSVGWVAGVAATALGCYMVSLQVASTRASLEEVETKIVIAQRDIRVLQTEIGTRGRLEQLERWNVKVLALSAPQANQFLDGGFQLATMMAPKKIVDPAAPVVLASAPKAEPKPVLEQVTGDVAPAGVDAKSMMHVASLKRDLPPPSVRSPTPLPSAEQQGSPAIKAQPATASIKAASTGKAPGKQSANQKAVDKVVTIKAAAPDTPAKAAKPGTSPKKAASPTTGGTSKSKEAKPKQ